MAGKKKIDWISAKQDYIASKDIGLPEIAVKYSVSYSSVKRMSKMEGWTREKDKIWAGAEKDALVEVEGSIKDLLKRHAKVARYLQAGGLRNLKLLLDEVEEKLREKDIEGARKLLKQLIFNKIISAGTLTTMVAEGLKAERELYPKQMQIEGDLSIQSQGMSKALDKALYDNFKRNLIGGKPVTNSIAKTGTKK